MRNYDKGNDTAIVSLVEPFLDMDTASLRAKVADQSVVERMEAIIADRIAPSSESVHFRPILRILAEMQAELHYLKAAYIESVRYRDPHFPVPDGPTATAKQLPGHFVLDMRGDITGRNWYHAEPDGRWAGPGTESTILFPALPPGTYELALCIVDEIKSGTISKMRLLVNGNAVSFERAEEQLPATIMARLLVPEDFHLPFWSVKLQFPHTALPSNSPSDIRLLSIRVSRLSLQRIP